jgi:hypothetical protein
MLPEKHEGECSGHQTSRDLVPGYANKIVIPFFGTIFFWESEDIPGVWLAYANPPHDVMAQGRPGGGYDSALASLKRTVHANRFWEREENNRLFGASKTR